MYGKHVNNSNIYIVKGQNTWIKASVDHCAHDFMSVQHWDKRECSYIPHWCTSPRIQFQCFRYLNYLLQWLFTVQPWNKRRFVFWLCLYFQYCLNLKVALDKSEWHLTYVRQPCKLSKTQPQAQPYNYINKRASPGMKSVACATTGLVLCIRETASSVGRRWQGTRGSQETLATSVPRNMWWR